VQSTLDLEQFRDLTLGDGRLMHEIVWALIEDTSRRAGFLERAIRDRNRQRVIRISRNAARACAGVGANAAAAALRAIGEHAEAGGFDACDTALATLRAEIETLRGMLSAETPGPRRSYGNTGQKL